MPRTLVTLVAALGLITLAEGSLKRETVCRLTLYPSGHYINWTNPQQKTFYAEKGLYNPKNILTSRVQMSGPRAFILTPRFLCGVPFTLGVVTMNGPCKAEPTLSPYPSWEAHDSEDKGIINAVDIFIDRKKILWILDIGIIETLDKPKVVCSPKVLAICMQAGKIVATVDLSGFSTNDSRFHELQVEVTEEDDTFIYVSDAGCKAIVVWDFSKDSGFKVQLPPEVAEDGSCKDILYLTLMNNSYIYFSFMNGRKMFRTSTSNLRCPKSVTEAEEVGVKPGKLVILGSDRKTKMFFRGKGDNQIYMWDICKPFKPCSFICIDAPPQGMYSTHVAVGYMKYMWALSSNFPDFASGNRGSVGPYVKLHPIYSLRCPDDGNGNENNNYNNGNGSDNESGNGNGCGCRRPSPPPCPGPPKCPSPPSCPGPPKCPSPPCCPGPPKCPGPPSCPGPPKCPGPPSCPGPPKCPGPPPCPGPPKCPGPPTCPGLPKCPAPSCNAQRKGPGPPSSSACTRCSKCGA